MNFMEFIQWALIVWAGIKIIDIFIELFPFLGGDGIQPSDITYWICRPFSFRSIEVVKFGMLLGCLVWIVLLLATGWAINSLFFI